MTLRAPGQCLHPHGQAAFTAPTRGLGDQPQMPGVYNTRSGDSGDSTKFLCHRIRPGFPNRTSIGHQPERGALASTYYCSLPGNEALQCGICQCPLRTCSHHGHLTESQQDEITRHSEQGESGRTPRSRCVDSIGPKIEAPRHPEATEAHRA